MLKRKTIAMAAAVLLLGGGMTFAQKAADMKAAPASAGSVDAKWEWKGTPKGKIGTDYMTISKPADIAPVAGSKGAVFQIIKGEAKYKTENGVTALYHNNKGSCTIDTIEKNKKCEYAITLDDAATVSFTVTGNGSQETSRCVVVKRGEDEVLLAIDNLDQDNPAEVLTLSNAEKGTYRILVNGSRIISIEAKN